MILSSNNNYYNLIYVQIHSFDPWNQYHRLSHDWQPSIYDFTVSFQVDEAVSWEW